MGKGAAWRGGQGCSDALWQQHHPHPARPPRGWQRGPGAAAVPRPYLTVRHRPCVSEGFVAAISSLRSQQGLNRARAPGLSSSLPSLKGLSVQPCVDNVRSFQTLFSRSPLFLLHQDKASRRPARAGSRALLRELQGWVRAGPGSAAPLLVLAGCRPATHRPSPRVCKESCLLRSAHRQQIRAPLRLSCLGLLPSTYFKIGIRARTLLVFAHCLPYKLQDKLLCTRYCY